MTREQIRNMAMTLGRKDTGDTEEQTKYNMYINMVYKWAAKWERVPSSQSVTTDSNGDFTLPNDYIEDNFLEDSDRREIEYEIVGYTARTKETNKTLTYHYFKKVDDLSLDTDEPVLRADHSIIAVGANKLYKLMKDDTQSADFDVLLRELRADIIQTPKKSKRVQARFSY